MSKLSRLKAGERVVVSSSELDTIEEGHDPVLSRLASVPNPNRVGILDAYVAWIKDACVRDPVRGVPFYREDGTEYTAAERAAADVTNRPAKG